MFGDYAWDDSDFTQKEVGTVSYVVVMVIIVIV